MHCMPCWSNLRGNYFKCVYGMSDGIVFDWWSVSVYHLSCRSRVCVDHDGARTVCSGQLCIGCGYAVHTVPGWSSVCLYHIKFVLAMRIWDVFDGWAVVVHRVSRWPSLYLDHL